IRRRAALIGLAGAAAVVLASGAWLAPRIMKRAPIASNDADRTARDANGSSNTEAAALFRDGVRSWAMASTNLALTNFRKAVELDPTFASARLRLVLRDMLWQTASTREEYAEVASHASHLADDERQLFDAVAPAFANPRQLPEAERRLADLMRARPSD